MCRFENDRCCERCGKAISDQEQLMSYIRKGVGRVVVFLCAVCLWAGVAVSDLGFTNVAQNDKAINDYSSSVDYIFNATTSASTIAVSTGEHMIDFANLYPVEQPTKILIQSVSKIIP